MSEVVQFTRRQDTTIQVIRVTELDREWPPLALIDFMHWFNAQIADIPSQHLANAEVEFGVDEHRSDSLATITISYTRAESDEEMQARARAEREFDEAREEHEMKLLRKLLDRYQHKL